MKKINITELSKEYCKSHNIPEYDSCMVLNEIKSIIEEVKIFNPNEIAAFISMCTCASKPVVPALASLVPT